MTNSDKKKQLNYHVESLNNILDMWDVIREMLTVPYKYAANETTQKHIKTIILSYLIDFSEEIDKNL